MMWDVFGRALNGLRGMLFPSGAARQDFGTETAITRDMQTSIDLWYSMYVDRPPWANADIVPLGLPAAIVRELARPAIVEFVGSVTGSARADYLDACLKDASGSFEHAIELGLALGGVAMRPYIYRDRIKVDVSGITSYQPTAFDEVGRCVGAVFRERIRSGGKYYVRLEAHDFEDGTYVVRNKAHESNQQGSAGRVVPLDTVPEWAKLEPEVRIDGVDRPLFAVFCNPTANHVDPSSKMGVSVYAGAVAGLIRECDIQWERLWWEYKSGERKIFAERTAGNAREFSRNRLYEFGPFMSSSGDFFREFSPDYRDEALYRGLQATLKLIEFQVGLAYGTLSDPQSVEKSATEILASKQRQYITESHIQRAFATTIDDLVYAMDAYTSLYDLAPPGDYELDLSFGDGVLEDPESRRQERATDMADLVQGIMSAVEYRAKWYGEDEDTARERLAKIEELADEPQDEVE